MSRAVDVEMWLEMLDLVVHPNIRASDLGLGHLWHLAVFRTNSTNLRDIPLIYIMAMC